MVEKGEERIVMDLEARLKEDRDGSLRSQVAAGIAEQIAATDATLKKGAPPDRVPAAQHDQVRPGVGEPHSGQGLVVLSPLTHPSCAAEGLDRPPCAIPHWFTRS